MTLAHHERVFKPCKIGRVRHVALMTAEFARKDESPVVDRGTPNIDDVLLEPFDAICPPGRRPRWAWPFLVRIAHLVVRERLRFVAVDRLADRRIERMELDYRILPPSSAVGHDEPAGIDGANGHTGTVPAAQLGSPRGVHTR